MYIDTDEFKIVKLEAILFFLNMKSILLWHANDNELYLETQKVQNYDK